MPRKETQCGAESPPLELIPSSPLLPPLSRQAGGSAGEGQPWRFLAVVVGLGLGKSGKDRVTTPTAFNAFKNNYILVYSLMMCDWLQAPTCTTSTASTTLTRATSTASSSPASDPPSTLDPKWRWM